jgi:2-polyprenyl-3-methyl-5-hydroxy-6-metoxy-1,4-benzoquinol methylase
MRCRFCKAPLYDEFIDLVNAPASNSFLTQAQLTEPELFYPLKVFVCGKCFLVQVDEYKKSESIFNSDYAYFSSYSTSWLAHAERYTDMIIKRLGLGGGSLAVEIASNDGYLLQYFLKRGIPVLGIDPTQNTAAIARGKGIETITEFFGENLALRLVKNGIRADLLLGNNVLAHVPDIVDFVRGMQILLAPSGVITMEFPHLMQLVEHNQFDTIYHEHFSYLSFYTAKRIFESQGLTIFDAEELMTHGGSLRIYARHAEHHEIAISNRVHAIVNEEKTKGICDLSYYKGFQQRALATKLEVLGFLLQAKKDGKKVAAYGAAAKGNTLLNYCGVKADLIEFVSDANPSKQNKYLPASHIPVVSEGSIRQERPDYVVVLPWNIKEEITVQLNYIRDWGGRFVVFIPELEIF